MIEGMKGKIAIATAIALGIYLALFIWLLSPGWLGKFLSDLPKWLDMAKWVLPPAFIVTAYFLVGFLDIHNWLEKTFFKERKKVDDYIRNWIITPCTQVSCTRGKRGILKDEERKLMNLFYTFISKGDTERERAFAYWGDYFISVNLIFISLLAFLATIVIVAFDLSRLTHPVPYLILILSILLILVRIKLKGRLPYPAEAQIDRILSQDYAQLRNKLPKYRTECQNCPLNPNASSAK
ncbi:MAG: hypothetical protein HY530_02330 [Chloroflexi bacterium]|nr:hypothetical protein [Chloroflexota bacterium]